MIRRLAEKTWTASRKEPRIARTVVLKLKTAEFNVLTRSQTPASPPTSCEERTRLALSLRDKASLDPKQRFRLVGVRLSNFRSSDVDTEPSLIDSIYKQPASVESDCGRRPRQLRRYAYVVSGVAN